MFAHEVLESRLRPTQIRSAGTVSGMPPVASYTEQQAARASYTEQEPRNDLSSCQRGTDQVFSAKPQTLSQRATVGLGQGDGSCPEARQ